MAEDTPASPPKPPPVEVKPFDIHAWLNEVVEWDSSIVGMKIQRPRHERISYLIFANQEFQFRGWTIPVSGPGGHQIGLNKDEGLSLLYINGVMAGLAAVGIDWEEAYRPYFAAYKDRFLAAPPGMAMAAPPAAVRGLPPQDGGAPAANDEQGPRPPRLLN